MDPEKSKPSSLDSLKELLLQPEKTRLRQVENRLDDPMTRAREISHSLPEAISLSVMKGNKLSRVLQPVIDDSLKESVRKNPKAIADAIYPALGPGIRKAISSTLMGMIQSLNQVLNHSFSIQGLKWRMEAFRSGKQFAEVVMLHTLLFQVEQIFLIHSDSGIVLEHVVAKDVISQDPDLVSGMLTAIQDFVRDSFHSESEDDLETLRMGSDRSVWVEKGEQAFIAAVIKGTPPVELRTVYQELIEEIHIKSGAELTEFKGDPLPFSLFRESLEAGLQFQEKKEKGKKVSPLIVFLFALAVILPSIWGYTAFKTHKDWQQRLATIKNQKGVIILSAQKNQDKYIIKGLRDPLVHDPLEILDKAGQGSSDIQALWQPFYSLAPEFILQRAYKILAPPASITLTLEHNIISAKGKASQDWIDTFQNKALSIPGINGQNDKHIVNTDRAALIWATKRLGILKIYFKNNSTDLVEGQEIGLSKLIKTIEEIHRKMIRLNTPVQITIMGHTDTSGTEEYNQKLSQDRAQKILAYIIAKGIDSKYLESTGVATKILLKQETQLEDRQFNRAVTFTTAKTGDRQ